jgi:hypothetical protein
MIGRETYDGHYDVGNPRRLRKVNEAVHRILDQLHAMLTSINERYSDDDFALSLADQITGLDLSSSELDRLLD